MMQSYWLDGGGNDWADAVDQDGGGQLAGHDRQELHEPDLILLQVWWPWKVEERDSSVLECKVGCLCRKG